MPNRKTFVITGATSGIGLIAATQIALQGHHLILLSRDSAKGDAARRAIIAAAPGATVELIFADLAQLKTVSEAARTIAASHPRIDVLINNAGIHAFKQRITVDGFPEMISVNHLAPWLLTTILTDRLVGSAPSRIVTVASEASRRANGLDPSIALYDKVPFTRLGSSVIYGRTKLMNIMFSLELSRRLASTGVAVNCLDPGFNVTGLGRELPFSEPLARLLRLLRVGDPAKGADIIVRLAINPGFQQITGGYFSVKDASPLVPVPPGGDVGVQQALWMETEWALLPYVHPSTPKH